MIHTQAEYKIYTYELYKLYTVKNTRRTPTKNLNYSLTMVFSKILPYFRSCSPRRAILFLCLLILAILYLKMRNYENYEIMVFVNSENNIPCVLPNIDPFDPKMMEFVWHPGDIKCDPPAVIYVDSKNNLQFNETALRLLNETPETTSCDITLFNRIQDDGISFLDPFPWKPGVNISRDFFWAKCTGKTGVLYEGVMSRIQRKTGQLQNLKDALNVDKYNVILFGLDSVSRSAAIRQLPKMYKTLTEKLGGYDFKGYMKVATNTFVNVVPILTGKFAYTDEIPIKEYVKGWLDNIPCIWKDFSEQKCPTLLAEDYPNLNMFNMEKNGFYYPPTDHYMRPFWKVKKKLVDKYFLKDGIPELQKKGNVTLDKSYGLCTADNPNHVTVMNYVKQFLTTYRDIRKFSFSFLTELAHDYQNVLQAGDNDLSNFMEWLSEEGHLNNTVLIVFSDHGMRFGHVQHLHVARIENRMPFLSIVIPESIKKKYPDIARSMKINQERLTTPFDLHATLRDLLNGNLKAPGSFKVRNKLRGISMFREIPESRSCADANVAAEFCTCYQTKTLEVDGNPVADRIANAAVDHMNRVLNENKKCAQLKLHKIIELNRIEQGLKHRNTIRSRFFWISRNKTEAEIRQDTRHSVVIETVPGNGRFYVTCDLLSNGDAKVLGSVDRVNKYGNQSICVKDHKLKHICYCK